MISTVNETFAFLFALEIIPALPRIPNLTMSLERGRRRGLGPFCFGPGFPIFGKELFFFKTRTDFVQRPAATRYWEKNDDTKKE